MPPAFNQRENNEGEPKPALIVSWIDEVVRTAASKPTAIAVMSLNRRLGNACS
jgi:hypothetical protein